jgi:hypothetical protein
MPSAGQDKNKKRLQDKQKAKSKKEKKETGGSSLV